MDRVRIGLIFRALRRHQGLRQADLAQRAGVSQQTISEVECGRFGHLSVDNYSRIAEALGAEIIAVPQWRGPKLARLLDSRHARLQNAIAAALETKAWRVRIEVPFNRYGDRGSVDLLAFREDLRALVIVEIKSELDSVEETIRVLNMKRRVVPGLMVAELGWKARFVGELLVLPESSSARAVVARHATSFASALPGRNLEVRRWLVSPSENLHAIWFFLDTTCVGGKADGRPPERVRVARKAGK